MTRGMLNTAEVPTSSLVTRMQAQLRQQVPPQFKQPFMAIVKAGKTLMFSDQTFRFTQEYVGKLSKPDDVPRSIAHGIVKAISIIAREAKWPEDINAPVYPASFPAALYLMGDALEYVEMKKQWPITEQVIDATTVLVQGGLFKLYGIDEAKAKQAIQYASQRGGQAERPSTASTSPTDLPQKGV